MLMITSFFAFTPTVGAQNEIGPEGHKLLWFLLVLAVLVVGLLVSLKPRKKIQDARRFFFRKRKVSVQLVKDRLYYPDNLELSVQNTGNTAVDIERPLLVFSSIWLKRKFRIKGTNNASIYPLFLDKGQSHTLNIDLNRFYGHDKSLKRLPRAKVIVSEVNGRRLGSCQVFLRKTLFNF